jgi:hypothetical protein
VVQILRYDCCSTNSSFQFLPTIPLQNSSLHVQCPSFHFTRHIFCLLPRLTGTADCLAAMLGAVWCILCTSYLMHAVNSRLFHSIDFMTRNKESMSNRRNEIFHLLKVREIELKHISHFRDQAEAESTAQLTNSISNNRYHGIQSKSATSQAIEKPTGRAKQGMDSLFKELGSRSHWEGLGRAEIPWWRYIWHGGTVRVCWKG